MPDYSQKYREEILSRLDIKSEYEQLGVKFSGHISAKGWWPCHNIYKEDEHPSCGIYCGGGKYRGIFVAHNEIEEGKVKKLRSFFDIASDFVPQLHGDWKAAVDYFAFKVGLKAKGYDPPSYSTIVACQANLTNEMIDHLMQHRAFTAETIEKFKIGWSVKKERFSYPVYDENNKLVNIRYHARKGSTQKPKVLNTTGYGDARLWGLDRLIKAPDGSLVVITEGEFDAMLVEQTTGIISVSPTNGVKSFLPEWDKYFYGKNIVFLWDCDKEGRQGLEKIVLPTFKQAVIDNKLTIKIIWIYPDVANKDHKDYTDWIVKDGGSSDKIHDMIAGEPLFSFYVPPVDLPSPLSLSSFREINHSQYSGKRISVPLYIYGENSQAFFSPQEIYVQHCDLLTKGSCKGKDDWQWRCSDPIPVQIGDRIQLASVSTSDQQLRSIIRDYICDKNRKPSIHLSEDKKHTITEVYAHQVLDEINPSDSNDILEKPIYVVSGDHIPIGKYQATGFVHSRFRDQSPTLLADHLEPLDEDWQAFDVQAVKENLRTIQEVSVEELLSDLSENVTKIYSRDELHLGALLTLCSPRWIDFPGEGYIRGWISAMVIGDTGEGKTAVSELTFKQASAGTRVSGMTTSRTGITYAFDYDEKKGWRLKAGALLKMSRQALIVDEAQDLPEEDLKTMAEALDTGQIKIARIETRTFEAETRCFFSCNPKDPKRKSNQKTMDSYRYPCRSLAEIFPSMMIRRIDLCLFATSYDIKDKANIYAPHNNKGPNRMTRANMRALVHYAWNLTPDQIVISDEVANLMRTKALELSEKFGQCADLPIVHPQDFRKTMCRLSTALAVIDLSSDDDFATITVKEDHVNYMANFITIIYSDENCKLNEYSLAYKSEHALLDPEKVYQRILKYKEKVSEGRWDRISSMIREIIKLDPDGNDRISQKYLSEIHEVERLTINRDLMIFVKGKLIDSARGYKPTTKLIRLYSYLEQYPGFFSEKVDDDNGDESF